MKRGTITKYKRRSDGRTTWGYYYKTDGKQFTKRGFETKSDARDALDAALGITATFGTGNSNAPTEPHPKGDTRTISEFLRYWLREHAAPRCERKTLERYGEIVAYLDRQIGDVPLSDLKTAHIQEAVNRLSARGGAITKECPDGRPLSAKTVLRRWATRCGSN
jgi:hypothetical protein